MPEQALLGRGEELDWLRALVAAARSGRGSAHVIEGDPGVGKTTLVSHALVGHPEETELIQIAGVEAELDLPFATLQRVVLARRAQIEGLSPEHRTTLMVATGLEDGAVGDRLTVGLALLTLLGALSEDTSVVVWIDDAQWVDSDSLAILAFVARRLLADRVLIVFTRRPHRDGDDPLAGIPVRVLDGIDRDSAVHLLATAVGRPVERAVAEQVATAIDGNPLALLDLGSELTRRQIEGTHLLPDPVPLGTHLQEHYARQIRKLPPDTRHWLLLAATEPEGDLASISTACAAADLAPAASSAAERAGLVVIADRVGFRHPLVRSAVYGDATREERREAHHQLAAAAERHDATIRALLHRAAAADGVDPDLADQLEAAAHAAAARANVAARAQFLIRAANASPPALRAPRLRRAAEAAIWAGAMTQARALIAQIDISQLNQPEQLMLSLMRDGLRLTSLENDAFSDRTAGYLELSRALARVGRRSEAMLALSMALTSSWLSLTPVEDPRGDALARHASLLTTDDDRSPLALSLRAFGTVAGHQEAASEVEVAGYLDAVAAYAEPATIDEAYLFGFAGVVHAAGLLFDDGRRDEVLASLEVAGRAGGGPHVLANMLSFRCHFDVQSGRLAAARGRFDEASVLLSLAGYPADYMPMRAMLAAIRGWTATGPITRDELAREVAECERIGYGVGAEQWRRAYLRNRIAEREYDDAWSVGTRLSGQDRAADGFLLADLIEVAARTGRSSTALALRAVLARRAERLPNATGNALRAWASVFIDASPEAALEEAAVLFSDARAPLYAARAHLELGERQRRQRRRAAALTHLEKASAIFDAEGATVWAERAERELAAAGVRREGVRSALADLTPQEATVARLAAEGATNGDIAERLYLSPNTVDYHLRKIFRKLGVTSRRQLRGSLV